MLRPRSLSNAGLAHPSLMRKGQDTELAPASDVHSAVHSHSPGGKAMKKMIRMALMAAAMFMAVSTVAVDERR